MKKLYTLLFLIVSYLLFSQNINIPDANFKALLLQSSSANYIAKDLNKNPVKIDINNDGEIQISEAENISILSLNNKDWLYNTFVYYFYTFPKPMYPVKEIYSLEGINYFKNLTILDCSFSKLSTIDFINLNKLSEIYCNNNQIIDIKNINTSTLFAIDCSNNKLVNLDFSNNNTNNSGYFLANVSNNNLVTLNIQNYRTTYWACLCDYSFCPFSYLIDSLFSTCRGAVNFYGNPSLNSLTVNCYEKNDYQNILNYEYPNYNTIIYDNCTASTKDDVLRTKFKIYPNPVKDYFNIVTKENISEIEILDSEGKIVSVYKNPDTKILTNNLSKGIYYLKILSNGEHVIFKLIKN